MVTRRVVLPWRTSKATAEAAVPPHFPRLLRFRVSATCPGLPWILAISSVSFVVKSFFVSFREIAKAVPQVILRLVLRNCRVIEGLEFE
jgi:hypothetical protein